MAACAGEVVKAVQSLAAAEWLLACWTVLLWRYYGERVTAIGVALDGRKYEELQQTLGLLTSYLPIRCAISGSQPFCALLQQVVERAGDARTHQEYFCWDQWSQLYKDASTPLPFTFDFVEQGALWQDTDLTVLPAHAFGSLEPALLQLTLFHRQNKLVGTLEYQTATNDKGTIAQLARQLEKLIQSTLAAPEMSVDRLALLDEDEYKRLVVVLNETAVLYPSSLFPELVEQQVLAHPERVAIDYRDAQLTYEQLNTRARSAGPLPTAARRWA